MTAPQAAGRVIVVGSVNIDLVVTGDRLPGPGETVTGGRFAQHHGGKGGNQAVAAARLGARTTFVGAVGDDPFGVAARAALDAEGVDTSQLVTLPGEATGVALILVDVAGENLISVAGGANNAMSGEVIRASLARLAPGPGDVILVGHEIPTDGARAALEAGRALGASTILNPAPAGGLDARTVSLADVVTPNQGEAAVLRAACGPLEALGGAILTSLGAAGARLDTAGSSRSIPTIPVVVVDTVGAGDTLNGALAAGLAEGRDIEQAAIRAVTSASLSVTRAGAREGMPTLKALETALSG